MSSASTFSSIVFALAPALRATDVSLVAGRQEAGRGSGTVRHRGGLAASLVVTQIALSMVLVATAALLVRSVRNLQHVDLGFNPRNVLLFRVDPTLNGYEEARVRATYARLLERLRAAPGVRGATLTNHTLISHSSSIGVAARPEEPLPEHGSEPASSFMETHQAWRLSVDPRFFTTMEIPILRGRALVREIDPNLPVFSMRTQDEQVAASLDRERLFARLAALLGIVTLALSAIGLYALLAYAVTRRTPEIGVRMALGADRSTVAWMILKQSLVLAAIGLLLGIVAAASGTKAIESLLYEMPARDPATFGGAAAIMLAVSVWPATYLRGVPRESTRWSPYWW